MGHVEADGEGPQADRTTPVRSVNVCVIDTGISPEGLPPERILGGVNFSGTGASADWIDRRGEHGNAVCRTILRRAPSARIFSLRVLDSEGFSSRTDNLDSAFEWLACNAGRLEIDVVCVAIADLSQNTSDEVYRGTKLQQAAFELRAARVPVVAPAGNRRDPSLPFGLPWPAILREIVSVGALDPDSRAPAASSGRMPSTVFACPDEPGGTSGAAAAIAGELAAMRAFHRDLPVDALMRHLIERCSMVMDGSGLSWPALASAAQEVAGESVMDPPADGSRRGETAI